MNARMSPPVGDKSEKLYKQIQRYILLWEIKGELVWLVRLLEPAHLFRFQLIRAGEAKPCGRMWDVVLIAGPPGCWDRRVSGAFGVNILCAGTWVLTEFTSFF